MNIEDIQKFLNKKSIDGNEYVRINFRKRDAVYGLFVKDYSDYEDLKAKNFWRIVPQSQFDAYRISADINLAKIFCGFDFTRLTRSKDHSN